MTDAQHYVHEAETLVLKGLSAEQSATAKTYIRSIVEDWLRQADESSSLDRDDLVEIGLSDLHSALDSKNGEVRLATLQALALKPTVQKLSGQAFDLAKQIADGNVKRRTVARQAEQLQSQIQRLVQEVRSLKDEENKRLLTRDLNDADLEVRYVLEEEEGAISIRLNRYING